MLSMAWAAPASAGLSFTLTSGDASSLTQTLPADSNGCPANGPRAAYVAGTLTNTGTATETGIVATLSGLPTGGFALTGQQTPAVAVGSLGAGDTIMVGWHVTYPCDTSNKQTPGPTVSIPLSVSSDQTAAQSQTLTLQSRKAISANAGGKVISTTLGPGAIVGQIITADVSYDFGGNSVGDEFVVQPAGNTDFDAKCLQLIGSEVTGSNVLAAPVGAKDQLYFVSGTSQSGNGYFIDVRYSYRYLCANLVTTARPFALQTSGGTNIKYTGNFDDGATDSTIRFDFPTSTNPFTITKTANVTEFYQGGGPKTVVYDVVVTNPSAMDGQIDSFSDSLPSGATYDSLQSGSDVTAANSGSLPVNGDSGTIVFQGLAGMGYPIAGGTSLTLRYSVILPDSSGDYTNTASAVVGSDPIGTDTETVVIGSVTIDAVKRVSTYGGSFAVPGEDVVYAFDLTHNGTVSSPSDTIILSDVLPGEIIFYNGDFDPGSPGMGPIDASLGSTGLTCCSAQVAYSDETSAPYQYDYTPIAGYDPAVTAIRVAPKGIMSPGTTLTVRFRAGIR